MVQLKEVSAYYYNEQVLRSINIDIPEFTILAVIGPAQSGKTTFLKLFNRLNEIKRGFRVNGEITIDESNILKKDTINIRRKVGFISSKPHALPGSVYENLVFGLRIQNQNDEEILENKVTEVLSFYQLLDEFENIFNEPARKLSKFKLQLLALARTLMLNPEVLLFDKPTKNLSEIATRRFEAIIFNLKKQHTIILEASSMRQARVLSDTTALIYNGNIIECNSTNEFFTQPKQDFTANYIRGKYDL